jgi:HlyD family secretion protein
MRKLILPLSLLLAVLLIAGVFFYLREQKPSDFLILYGNVDVREVDLGFRVEGRVVEMPFQEGDYVKKGQLMASLEKKPYSDQVIEAQANIESTTASFNNAELVYKRREALLPTGAVSQEDHDNARAQRDTYAANLKELEAALRVAQKNFQDTELFCPNDGIILTRIREPGTVVEASVPIYTLSLLDPVWVRAFVSETDLGNIYFGMAAEVRTDAGRVYKGHIGFISPVAEFTPKTVETAELRTDLVYRLRIIADNPDRYLKQGMPVTVKLWKHGNPNQR